MKSLRVCSFIRRFTSNNKVIITNKKIINSQNINDNLGSNEKYLNFKEQKSDSYSFCGLVTTILLTQRL